LRDERVDDPIKHKQRGVTMKGQTAYCTLAFLLGLVLTTLALWLCATRPALADPTERYVAETGSDGSNDCKNPSAPCKTIQHAIDVAVPEDAIHIAGGTYTSAAGPVAVITKSLAIVGSFDPSFTSIDPTIYQTTLDAGWKSSVISISNASNVVLDFLSLTHGDGTDSCLWVGCGGGIYATNAGLQVSHCVIIDNVGSRTSQGFGGGVYSYSSTVSINGSRIVSNVANIDPASTTNGHGGGIYAFAGKISLVESQIIGNVAHVSFTGHGGGLFFSNMTRVEILSNVVRNNRAVSGTIAGYGGGIYIDTTDWSYIANNHIEGNQTSEGYGGAGGGISLNYGEAHLTGNTIFSNTAAGGGGILMQGSEQITLSNNLIAHNYAALRGGGIYVVSSEPSASQAILINNTIADNGDTGVVGWQYVALAMTNNLIAGHATGVNTTVPASATVAADTNLFWNTHDPITGTNAILQDPLLAPGYGLGPGSPALDNGLTIPWLTVDLEGTARPQGSAYDIGAFEGERPAVFLPLVLRNSP
jgi:hypothetical protein